MPKDEKKIISLKHTDIESAKKETETYIKSVKGIEVPRMTIDIIQNRWRAISLHGTMIKLDPDVEEIVSEAIKVILRTDIIVDQRDIYYSLRMGHPDWTLAGHPLKTEEAYNTFVGAIMEKLQLATGYTMQSLGVRAGPRGYITGDDYSFFRLPDGKTIKLNANPVIQFNLVDEGVEFSTQARKLIHYEKAAGMNSITISDLPLMIEAIYMTSQGYAVEAATKLHRDMEKRGIPLYVLGDADPHGMSIQLMYGRASKSNAYMPDSFYPSTAVLLGLNPRIAKALSLPSEHVTDVHMRVVDNLKKLISETHPDMMGDAEIFEKLREQWEWQSLNGIDQYAPAIYLVESLYAKNNEIKYVPDPETSKATMEQTINQSLDDFVNDTIESYARTWLMDNLKPELIEQLKEKLESKIREFKAQADQEMEHLRRMRPEDIREAIKLKLVKDPKQYWTDAIRKVIRDILTEKFEIDGNISGRVTVTEALADVEVEIANPEVPEQPLTKKDIVESIERKITRNVSLVQRLRQAIQSIFGTPSEDW
jgi:DNA topoisomerase VI subunit A